MQKLLTLTAAAALTVFGFGGVAYAGDIDKDFTVVTVPDNDDPITQGAGTTTTYEFTIDYDGSGNPAVTILDVIPSEFTAVAVNDVNGDCTSLTVAQKGGGGTKGSTHIACTLNAGDDATLRVTFETRNNPGHGKRNLFFFEPTECTFDDLLLLNDGAVAVDVNDIIIEGPTDQLTVTIDGCDD